MNAMKSFVLTAAIIGVSACSAFSGNNEVEKLEEASAVGSPFNQQLTAEYRAFSNYELNTERDYADALHFARKGLAAAEGTNVMPEPVSDWNINAGQIVELSEAYERLVSAIDRGAREILPAKTAIAQARYDCWIEEEEEVAAGGNMDVPCKADFMAAMSEIEAAIPAAAPQPQMAQPTMGEEFPAPVTMLDSNEPLNIQEAMYLVFFDFDMSNINQGGMDVVQTVVNEMQSRNIQNVRVVGHTDTSGSESYNQALAMRRAESVKSQMVLMGIPAGNITTEARGESDLLVETQDGIREPANRRSVITFE
jgi:OOP family OmpA-OmpF porin